MKDLSNTLTLVLGTFLMIGALGGKATAKELSQCCKNCYHQMYNSQAPCPFAMTSMVEIATTRRA